MKENTVFIGSKKLMNYVLAIVTQFNATDAEEVVVKARGRAISTAVDVCEVTKNRFLPDIDYKEIKLSTETAKREDGSELNVSSFEAVLTRNTANKGTKKSSKKGGEKKSKESE